MKQKLKFSILLLFLLSILLPFSLADATNLKLTTEDISPQPVEPGQELVLKTKLQNFGTKDATGVNVEYEFSYPFILNSESQNFKGNENICSQCSKDNTYYFTIDANAQSGIYTLKFDILQSDGGSKTTEIINVKVQGKPDVIFQSEPVDSLAPNDKLSAKFTLHNIGSGTAKNIKIESNSDDFIKLGGGTEYIETLKSDEKHNLTINFQISEYIKPNGYKIPITLSYTDQLGSKIEQTQYFGVKIAHKAKVGIQSLKIVDLKSEIELNLKIENVGSGDANNVEVKLESPLSGTKTTYLGTLEADDDRPSIFILSPKSQETDNKIIITYDDDFGVHTIEKEFKIPGSSNLTKFYIIGLAALAIIIAIIIKLKK